MTHQSDLVSYYRARANEYEKVYAKPERQQDLSELHAIVPAWFTGRHVLEVACGTGYWTRRIAARATPLTACDLAPETLEIAQALQPATAPVNFVLADAFALLDNGSEYEVLKNFPTSDDVRDALLAVGAADLVITQLPYYWYTTYQTPR